MKKIICLCFCAGIMNLIGDVGVLSRSKFETSERLLHPKRKFSYNNIEFLGKRPKSNSEELKANSETTDLYYKYYNNPDKFLKDLQSIKNSNLQNIKNTNYLKSMLYTLGKYDFFYETWGIDSRKKCNKELSSYKRKNTQLKYPLFEENPYEKYRGLLSGLDGY